MTIDKAIKILQALHNGGISPNDPNPKDAFKLGIEALEEVKYYRSNPISYVLKLLPGETE